MMKKGPVQADFCSWSLIFVYWLATILLNNDSTSIAYTMIAIKPASIEAFEATAVSPRDDMAIPPDITKKC